MKDKLKQTHRKRNLIESIQMEKKLLINKNELQIY